MTFAPIAWANGDFPLESKLDGMAGNLSHIYAETPCTLLLNCGQDIREWTRPGGDTDPVPASVWNININGNVIRSMTSGIPQPRTAFSALNIDLTIQYGIVPGNLYSFGIGLGGTQVQSKFYATSQASYLSVWWTLQYSPRTYPVYPDELSLYAVTALLHRSLLTEVS